MTVTTADSTTGELSEVSWKVAPGDELPYRCTMRDKFGAGDTPRRALMAVLRAAQCIPAGCADWRTALHHVFWAYGPPYPKWWTEIITVLETNEVPI